jgi:hypothetical protein
MDFQFSGTWSGLMTDVEGYNARATLRLEQTVERVNGQMSLQVSDDHKVGAEQRGTCAGETRELQLVLRCALGGQAIVMFDARTAEVHYHAKGALVGTYAVNGTPGTTLSSGVVILWKYSE